MDQETFMGLLRHALTVSGGALVSAGYMNDGQLQTIVGALIVIAGVGWSIVQKQHQRDALAAAAATAPVAPPIAKEQP